MIFWPWLRPNWDYMNLQNSNVKQVPFDFICMLVLLHTELRKGVEQRGGWYWLRTEEGQQGSYYLSAEKLVFRSSSFSRSSTTQASWGPSLLRPQWLCYVTDVMDIIGKAIGYRNTVYMFSYIYKRGHDGHEIDEQFHSGCRSVKKIATECVSTDKNWCYNNPPINTDHC